jgi:hypothetical protein
VKWWDSAISAVPVHDGEPRMQFDPDTLMAEDESALLVGVG